MTLLRIAEYLVKPHLADFVGRGRLLLRLTFCCNWPTRNRSRIRSLSFR